jgi:hypothetical protein
MTDDAGEGVAGAGSDRGHLRLVRDIFTGRLFADQRDRF